MQNLETYDIIITELFFHIDSNEWKRYCKSSFGIWNKIENIRSRLSNK